MDYRKGGKKEEEEREGDRKAKKGVGEGRREDE